MINDGNWSEFKGFGKFKLKGVSVEVSPIEIEGSERVTRYDGSAEVFVKVSREEETQKVTVTSMFKEEPGSICQKYMSMIKTLE